MCCVFFLHLVDLDIETVALLLRAAPRVKGMKGTGNTTDGGMGFRYGLWTSEILKMTSNRSFRPASPKVSYAFCFY